MIFHWHDNGGKLHSYWFVWYKRSELKRKHYLLLLIGRRKCSLIWFWGEFSVEVQMNMELNLETSQEVNKRGGIRIMNQIHQRRWRRHTNAETLVSLFTQTVVFWPLVVVVVNRTLANRCGARRSYCWPPRSARGTDREAASKSEQKRLCRNGAKAEERIGNWESADEARFRGRSSGDSLSLVD